MNGLRAVHKKGEFSSFMEKNSPDILCLQETKSTADQVSFLEDEFPEYVKYYVSAEKKGYSGVSIWVKNELGVSPQFFEGMEDFYHCTEGRVARVDLHHLVIFSVYFPNGGKSEEAWKEKLIFYKQFLQYIQHLEERGKTVIFCGDINCCHNPIDIARPKENDGKVGFHPDERACLSEWIHAGWKDVWREENPTLADQYSWWSYRGGARDRNVGWRIDYFFVPESFLSAVLEMKYLNEQMGSDHCPVSIRIAAHTIHSFLPHTP